MLTAFGGPVLHQLATPLCCLHMDQLWRRLDSCVESGMTFSTFVDRVRSEFVEMPGLELTVPQAVRLLGLGLDDCRHVIDALVDAGFLRWTAKGTVVQARRDVALGALGGQATLESQRQVGRVRGRSRLGGLGVP